jgi:hypothetical protein
MICAMLILPQTRPSAGCARNFIQHGTPDTESVLFEPD